MCLDLLSMKPVEDIVRLGVLSWMEENKVRDLVNFAAIRWNIFLLLGAAESLGWAVNSVSPFLSLWRWAEVQNRQGEIIPLVPYANMQIVSLPTLFLRKFCSLFIRCRLQPEACSKIRSQTNSQMEITSSELQSPSLLLSRLHRN